MLDEPLRVPPFTEEEVSKMRGYFLRNLNTNGTGACTASEGRVPALEVFHIKGGYKFDWMRDCALSMAALMRFKGSEVGWVGDRSKITEDVVSKTLGSYLNWVERVQNYSGTSGLNPHVDPQVDPRWQIATGEPTQDSWCRPQTDGPALRARALMDWGDSSPADVKARVWALVKFDLDWLANGTNIALMSCDLWEESRDRDMLWNRMMQRAALIRGVTFANAMGDTARSASYQAALNQYLANPLDTHTKPHPMHMGTVLSQCPNNDPDSECHRKEKDMDGAIILSLMHSGWMEFDGPAPASTPISDIVARTVLAIIEANCDAYHINRHDTEKGVPGILIGRYAADAYGGGNPWVLLTAALASLLYQAAQVVAKGVGVDSAALPLWQQALRRPSFGGLSQDFIAAGDSVLSRLRHHISDEEDMHLYEQLDRHSGKQYNAEDLTWSYAETMLALQERSEAVEAMYAAQQQPSKSKPTSESPRFV